MAVTGRAPKAFATSVFSAAVTLALPIGTVAALSAGPVGAATTKTITCTKVTGNINRTIEIKGCNGNTGTKSKKVWLSPSRPAER
jgi:hypothetical protein